MQKCRLHAVLWRNGAEVPKQELAFRLTQFRAGNCSAYREARDEARPESVCLPAMRQVVGAIAKRFQRHRESEDSDSQHSRPHCAFPFHSPSQCSQSPAADNLELSQITFRRSGALGLLACAFSFVTEIGT